MRKTSKITACVVGERRNDHRRPHWVAVMDFSRFNLVFAAGARVTATVGVRGRVADLTGEVAEVDGRRVVVTPHPSGLNRFWNNRGAVI